MRKGAFGESVLRDHQQTGESRVSDEFIGVALKVVEQGAVVVNSARIHRGSKAIVCVEMDLRSKYAKLDWIGGGDDEPPSISLIADERTLILHRRKPRDSATMVAFPEYKGWRVFAAEGASRYTVRICLVAPARRATRKRKDATQ